MLIENLFMFILELFKIIIPVIATLTVTRYSLISPRRTDIMKKQFKQVYLPLYRLIQQYELYNNPSKKQVLRFNRKMLEILDENYEYADSRLHSMSKSFVSLLNCDKDYNQLLQNIIRHIEYDYEWLRRHLGYPSKNLFQLFIMADKKDKVFLVLLFLMALDIIFFAYGINRAVSGYSVFPLIYSGIAYIILWILIRDR